MAHRQGERIGLHQQRGTSAVLMKVQRGLSPASVNQALAGMDHLVRFLGLGAAIVRREELPRSAPRARRRAVPAAAAGPPRSPRGDRAIVTLLLFTGLRLSEAAALQVGDMRISARKGVVVVREPLRPLLGEAMSACGTVRTGGVGALALCALVEDLLRGSTSTALAPLSWLYPLALA